MCMKIQKRNILVVFQEDLAYNVILLVMFIFWLSITTHCASQVCMLESYTVTTSSE